MTSDQLLNDMKANFPGIFARPLYEFGAQHRQSDGIWTGGDASMSDGVRIFGDYDNPATDEMGIHAGFSKWLANRGWYVESYDAETYLIVRLPTSGDIERLKQECISAGATCRTWQRGDDAPF